MQERASLEKHFAKELASFAERWEDKLHSRVPEYGTLKDGWLAVTSEARQLADIHMRCKVGSMSVCVCVWDQRHTSACSQSCFSLNIS